MSWWPAIPNEANLVRSASGDLIKIKENFDLLSGVANKGISGIIGTSVDSPTSGQFLRYSGSQPTGLWRPSGVRLDEIDDVNAPSPTSGQALTFSGAVWIAATPVQTVSGLTDVQMNPPTPLSGQALVYSGTHPTGKWTPSSIQISFLDDIGDVNAPAPTSGQFLAFDGSAWVASGFLGINRVLAAMTDTMSVVTGVTTIVSGLATAGINEGGWTITTTGIVVPSGVTAVRALAQAHWDTTISGTRSLRIYKNGAPLQTSGAVDTTIFKGTGAQATLENISQTTSWVFSVSGGDIVQAAVESASTTASPTLLSGGKTWLYVEEAKVAGGTGGGSATAGILYEGFIGGPSGLTIAAANNTNTRVTGLTGGNAPNRSTSYFSTVSAASGIILISAGHPFSHVEVTAAITWSGLSTGVGFRRLEIHMGSGEMEPTTMQPLEISEVAPVVGTTTLTRMHYHSCLIAVPTGQLSFAINARHLQGTTAHIFSDGASSPRIWLHVRGWILTSG